MRYGEVDLADPEAVAGPEWRVVLDRLAAQRPAEPLRAVDLGLLARCPAALALARRPSTEPEDVAAPGQMPAGALPAQTLWGIWEDKRLRVVSSEALVERAVICADLPPLWAEPERLVLTGETASCPQSSTLVVPVDDSTAGRCRTALVARWSGAEWVRIYVPPVVLGPGELREAQGEMLGLLAHARLQSELAEAGHIPAYWPGRHCERCVASWRCPAVAGFVGAVIDGHNHLLEGTQLGADGVVRALDGLAVLEIAGRAIRAAARRYVTLHGPVELPDGTFWGPAEHRSRYVSASAFYCALASRLSDDAAERLVAANASFARTLAREAGPEVVQAVKDALAEAAQTGSVERTRMRWGYHNAQPEQEAAQNGGEDAEDEA